MLTLLSRLSKYSVVILGFLAITLSHAQEDRAEDISILDVDANGEVDALTDGLLLLRSMFELTDDALVTGVVDSANCTECDAEGIDSYITSIKGTTYGGLTPEAGPQGEKGDKGDTGSQGIQGIKGDTGSQGIAGTDGAKGDTGATGATGPQGATGAIGASGVAGSVTELTDALVQKSGFGDSIYIGNDPTGTTNNAEKNVAVGITALGQVTTGDGNVAVGYDALKLNSIGFFNTATGVLALASNTEGDNNTALGVEALFTNISGQQNTASGAAALFNNTTGGENTASGNEAMHGNTSGHNNTASGYDALRSNITGSNNTAIGFKADVLSSALENATAVGNGAIVSASNTMQLGNTSVTNVKTSGSVTAGAITIPNTDGSTGQLLATDGSGQLYWLTLVPLTEAQASAITANTVKTGITSDQANAITANTVKTGITSDQANAITANTAKTVLALGTTSSTALAGDTTTISQDQADEIDNAILALTCVGDMAVPPNSPSYWNSILDLHWRITTCMTAHGLY